MKVFIYLFIYLSSQQLLFTQTKAVYLFFDSKNKDICNIPKAEQCRFHGVEKDFKFNKIEQKNNIEFYICRELFILNKKSKIDTLSIDFFKKIKLSSIFNLKSITQKKNPLYPNKVFKKIYLIEPINDSLIVKYPVDWRYYIE